MATFTIPDIPQTISRTAYVELIASLGLDSRDIKSMHFNPSGIYVEVAVRDTDGKLMLAGPNELAKHSVYIEVTD